VFGEAPILHERVYMTFRQFVLIVLAAITFAAIPGWIQDANPDQGLRPFMEKYWVETRENTVRLKAEAEFWKEEAKRLRGE